MMQNWWASNAPTVVRIIKRWVDCLDSSFIFRRISRVPFFRLIPHHINPTGLFSSLKKKKTSSRIVHFFNATRVPERDELDGRYRKLPTVPQGLRSSYNNHTSAAEGAIVSIDYIISILIRSFFFSSWWSGRWKENPRNIKLPSRKIRSCVQYITERHLEFDFALGGNIWTTSCKCDAI